MSSKLLGEYQAGKIDKDEGASDDELWDLLEDDEASGFSSYRAERMQQMAEEVRSIQEQTALGFGELKSFDKESDLLEAIKNKHNSRILVLFSNKSFKTCQIMHEKLQAIARKHIHTRVFEIQAVDAVFLTQKLNVRVLPCVIGYRDGNQVLRLDGFDQLGNTESFELSALERVLVSANLIRKTDLHLNINERQASRAPKQADSDSDWD